MSSAMIRSAINKSAKRCTQNNILNNKATLSTLSFHPSSLFNNVQSDSTTTVNDMSTSTSWFANMSTKQLPLILNTASSYINNITSHFSNTMMTNLSGDYTLVTMDSIARKLEEEKEEGDWEDIIIATTPKTTIMESPQEEESNCLLEELSLWQISTLKRRKKMMNKHKLRKRRKKNRLKTRK